jgi:hypothetical protein
MTDEDTGKATVISEAISVWKDLVSLLRDSSLLLLAVLLIAFPTRLNSVLVSAGFEEGSVVGFKWKSKLVDSDAALKETRATISDLQKKNDEMAKALAEANAQINDPALKENIAKLEQENKQLMVTTQQVQASVSNTIASNAPLVDKALSVTTANKWGVVFSGDSTLESAKYEVDVVAPKLGLPNPSIYFRQGSYRSVSVVADKQQADQILPKAKMRRQDAYIVNMSTWCPTFNQRTGYFECTAS